MSPMSYVKSVAKGLLRRAGYQLRRMPLEQDVGELSSPYECALLALLHGRERVKVVVVGANDGVVSDPIYPFLRRFVTRTEVLLIEPQAQLIPLLEQNYAFHSAHDIFHGAVGGSGELELYCVGEHVWDHLEVPYAKGWPRHRAPTGVTSASEAHVRSFVEKYLKDKALRDGAVVKLNATRCPLVEVMNALGLARQVDVLQVDAEGFDDDVIYHSSIEILRPKLILFESANLPLDRRKALRGFLEERDYVLSRQGENHLAISCDHDRTE